MVAFNYNDRRYMLGPDQVDGEERFAQQFDALVPEPGPVENIYLYRALRLLLRRVGVGGVEPAAAQGGTIRLDETFARVDPAAYRANLVGIIDAARERGVRVILMSTSDNPVQIDHFEHGVAALDAGRVDEQMRTLTVSPFISLPGGTPVYPDSRYHEVMREVADELGVELFDAAEVLEPARYLDQVHPDPEGHRAIGEALYERFLQSEAQD